MRRRPCRPSNETAGSRMAPVGSSRSVRTLPYSPCCSRRQMPSRGGSGAVLGVGLALGVREERRPDRVVLREDDARPSPGPSSTAPPGAVRSPSRRATATGGWRLGWTSGPGPRAPRSPPLRAPSSATMRPIIACSRAVSRSATNQPAKAGPASWRVQSHATGKSVSMSAQTRAAARLRAGSGTFASRARAASMRSPIAGGAWLL